MNGLSSDLLLTLIFLLLEPLFWLLIISVVGLAFFSRRVIVRKPLHRWLTMGLCAASLLVFCTIEWFGWGLYDAWGWGDKGLLLLYEICIVAGAGSGWLLYQGGWRHRADEPKTRRWGYVLRGLGLLLWSVAFLITFAANIWWATI